MIKKSVFRAWVNKDYTNILPRPRPRLPYPSIEVNNPPLLLLLRLRLPSTRSAYGLYPFRTLRSAASTNAHLFITPLLPLIPSPACVAAYMVSHARMMMSALRLTSASRVAFIRCASRSRSRFGVLLFWLWGWFCFWRIVAVGEGWKMFDGWWWRRWSWCGPFGWAATWGDDDITWSWRSGMGCELDFESSILCFFLRAASKFSSLVRSFSSWAIISRSLYFFLPSITPPCAEFVDHAHPRHPGTDKFEVGIWAMVLSMFALLAQIGIGTG